MPWEQATGQPTAADGGAPAPGTWRPAERPPVIEETWYQPEGQTAARCAPKARGDPEGNYGAVRSRANVATAEATARFRVARGSKRRGDPLLPTASLRRRRRPGRGVAAGRTALAQVLYDQTAIGELLVAFVVANGGCMKATDSVLVARFFERYPTVSPCTDLTAVCRLRWKTHSDLQLQGDGPAEPWFVCMEDRPAPPRGHVLGRAMTTPCARSL